jgi:hypothetical protein
MKLATRFEPDEGTVAAFRVTDGTLGIRSPNVAIVIDLDFTHEGSPRRQPVFREMSGFRMERD